MHETLSSTPNTEKKKKALKSCCHADFKCLLPEINTTDEFPLKKREF
jgi:hypothetical protein